MYLLVRGTALEIQDKLAGKMPVMVDKFVVKEVEVPTGPASDPIVVEKEVPVPTPHKITSAQFLGIVKLSDEIFVEAVDAEVTEWEDESSSDSTSSEG